MSKQEILKEFDKKFPDPMEDKYGKGFKIYCTFCKGNEPIKDFLSLSIDKTVEEIEERVNQELQNNIKTQDERVEAEGYREALNDILQILKEMKKII